MLRSRRFVRSTCVRPHTDAFFVWVAAEYDRVKDIRGLLRSALGYAHRQRGPLTRFFDDGRLALDNNASERELRRIAVGRNYAELPIMRSVTSDRRRQRQGGSGWARRLTVDRQTRSA
jgi:hypothetical protein